MRNIQMAKGAHTVVNRCARVKPGETVVIVTEPSRMSIAEELGAAVCAAGGEPVFCSILPRERDGQEPPAPAAAAMKAADVFLCVVGKSITHTQAVKEAVAQGARGLVLTHFTEEMLVRGGIEADFPAIAPTCRAIAQALQGAQTVRLTSRHGTDLTYSAKGRRGNALYGVVEPGEFSTIPTIEANVSPLEGTANGVIVADASIPYIGIGVLEEPVVCRVRDGRITSIEGGRQAQMLKDDLASKADPNVYNIAEMGMGLNPKCHFCGFMLEDEGVEGSVHIGVLEEPVVCRVRDGRITSIEGGRQAQMLKDDLASKADPNVYNIAEMGMGLNPKCHFCGFMLEDEGVEGSVHIGIGTSITLGGTVKAACHYDLIMTGATVVADGRVLLQDGVVQL